MKKGFSLVEALLVTAILSIILGAVFGIAYQAQRSFQSEREYAETTQHARVAMDQIIRYVRQAGNDPLEVMEGSNTPPVEILSDGGGEGQTQFRINSDITGSSDDNLTGDPDGGLTSPMEQVTVSYFPDSQQLLMDINDGNGSQLMADNITDFTIELFNSAGEATTDENAVVRVRVEMTAETANPDQRTGQVNSVTFTSDVYIRNRGYNLFQPGA
jgi:prepilin-type N-terminal cleavage/methylation domain-containing protein